MRVLFVCTHNSARSQMAEALLRTMGGDRFECHSAGIAPGGVHPLAVEAMSEIGVDITGQESKSIERYRDAAFDYVVTVCDEAREACPFFPARNQLHWSLPDPSAAPGDPEARKDAFRAVRDRLRALVAQFSAGAE
ncbi:MAG: arsenate reductase ArsC [bacterium]|nr:arsenate reductase ArsC [bacterium]